MNPLTARLLPILFLNASTLLALRGNCSPLRLFVAQTMRRPFSETPPCSCPSIRRRADGQVTFATLGESVFDKRLLRTYKRLQVLLVSAYVKRASP